MPQPPRSADLASSPPAECSGKSPEPRLLSVLHPASSSRVRPWHRTRVGTACLPHGRLPVLRCVYWSNLQCESLALPRVTGVVEEAATKHVHTIRQGRVIEFVALLLVLDVVVIDGSATVDFLRSDLRGFAQLIEFLW